MKSKQFWVVAVLATLCATAVVAERAVAAAGC